ncbi:MAG: glycosyltransferase [Desulfarculaceae bacterium]|nr:glycosyltransferase [Desulfarculaceae bacterium]
MISRSRSFNKHPLKILFLSDAIAGRNGVGAYYADLVEHLTVHVEHAELVSPGTEGDSCAHEVTLPMPGDATQRLYLPRVTNIWQKVNDLAPDLIVLPTPGPYGVTGFVIARYLNIPICSGYHTEIDQLSRMYWNSVFSIFGRLYMKSVNRLFFCSSAMVVGNSEKMIHAARNHGAYRVKTIGTPIAGTFTDDPPPPVSTGLSTVCYAGRLAPEKNIQEVLEAARALPETRFLIAGDGPLRDLVIETACSCPNVEYMGWVSRPGVKQAIDASDMLLLPSRVESFGTIALEAMARRRLVLVSDNCGILNWPDLAEGVYAIGVEESLAEAVKRISDKPVCQRLERSEIARRTALEFNRKTLSQWIDLFCSLKEKRFSP